MIGIKHNVKEWRERKGISKAALARRVGVNRSYITKLENEELQPSGPAMLRFARYFGRPVEEIFHLPEEERKNEFGKRTNFPGVSLPASGELTKLAEINKQNER